MNKILDYYMTVWGAGQLNEMIRRHPDKEFEVINMAIDREDREVILIKVKDLVSMGG